MSSLSEEKSGLSSSELRSKIYERFKSKGVLDAVKTQLRNRLALELNHDLRSSNHVIQPPSDGSLFLSVSNSLFVDHLKRCSYDYTLSVFLSESLLPSEKAISIKEIMQLLQIHPESKLYQELMNLHDKNQNFKSFLWSFLVKLAESNGHSMKETGVQTNPMELTGNLNEKLIDVEKLQLEKHKNAFNNDTKNIEAKMLSYQRKCEAQKQAELKAEIERYHSSELSNMRLEERERYQQEIKDMKSKYDADHRRKVKDLEELREELEEKSRRQDKMLGSEAYEKRQQILEEMHSLKEREVEMKATQDKAMKSLELEQEKLKLQQDQLRLKEMSIKQIEDRYDEKVQAEIIKVKYEIQEENKQHVEMLQSREQQLREEKVAFQAQKDLILKSKSDHDALRQQNQKLQLSHNGIQREFENLKYNHEELQQRYRKYSNYEELKQKNQILLKELEYCKKEIDNNDVQKALKDKEHQKLVRELLSKISSTTIQQTDYVNEEVLRERVIFESKKREMQEKIRLLQRRFDLEVSKNDELRQLYNDLLLTEKDMAREIDELREALTRTQKDNDGFKRARNTERQSYVSEALRKPYIHQQQQYKYTDIATSRPSMYHSSTSFNKSSLNHAESNDILRTTETNVDNLKRLEIEANEFENSYKDFLDRQKQLKTPSRVHFDALVQTHSPQVNYSTITSYQSSINTGVETLNLSRLLPNQTLASFQRLPNPGQALAADESRTSSQPLSSTQAPGGYEAPSFGISGVMTADETYKTSKASVKHFDNASSETSSNVNNRYLSLSDKMLESTHAMSHPLPTCYSLSQHPLAEPTMTTESFTQYPLLDSKSSKTLTQYPLVDSNFRTPQVKEWTLKTPMTQRLDTVTEQSTHSEEAQHVVDKKRIDSVEKEYHLNEASIHTFESPKDNNKKTHDIIESLSDQVSKQSEHSKDDNLKEDHSNNNFNDPIDEVFENDQEISIRNTSIVNDVKEQSSVVSDVINSKHSVPIDQRLSEGGLSESKSTLTNAGEMKTNELLDSLSEGEINEEQPPPPVNLMDQYMQLLLNKKSNNENNENEVEGSKKKEVSVEKQFFHDDITISEVESEKNVSEKSSEYEW